jgi:ketosteroid isomerase-like protein
VTLEHPNAAKVRATYEALAAGRIDVISDSLADDLVLHVPGAGAISGEYHGKEAVFALFTRWFAETQGTFRLELIDVMANDTYAVALHHVTAERNGKRLDMKNFAVFEINADGKAVGRWEFLEDVDAHDEFWS